MQAGSRIVLRSVFVVGTTFAMMGCYRAHARDVDASVAPIDDAGPVDAGPDAGTVDAGTCTPSWAQCRVSVGPMLVSGTHLGQAPDVCWFGDRLLVVYDDEGGNTLATIDLAGRITSEEAVGGIQDPRIECHPDTRAALIVADSGLRWVGTDGHVTGAFVRVDVEGFQLSGDVSAVPGGFVVMSGALAWSEPPPLFAAFVPTTPIDSVTLSVRRDGGPRLAPQHATDDRGMGTLAASLTYGSGLSDLWDLRSSDPPTYVRDLALTSTEQPTALGLAELAGVPHLFYSDRTADGLWHFYVEDLDTGRARLLTETNTSISGALEPLDGALIVAVRARPPGESSERVLVARTSIDALRPLEGAISLSEPGRVAHSERMTRTPRGLAIVWSEATGDTDGNSARLAILDCCP